MNFDNPKTQQPPRVNSFSKFWKRKTKLEQKLLILLIIAVILLIGLILFIIIIHAVRPNICKTPVCIQSAAEIFDHIDETVDPCDDFYKFACGNFVKSLHGNSKDSSINKQKQKVKNQLEEILKSPISEDDNKWLTNQKRMYNTCLNKTEAEEEAYNIVMETINELHGWPVITGFSWKDWNFDWKEVIFKLKEKGFSYRMLFGLHIMEDPIKTDRHIIKVYVPYINKVSAEKQNLYKKFMTETVIQLGADKNRAANEMEKVLDFIDNILKITESFDKEKEADDNINHTQRYKVEEYQKINGDLNWLDFINSLLNPVGQIYEDDEVIFPNSTIVEALFRFINRTPKRILANYIMWSMFEDALEFMPARIREPEGNYTCITGSSNEESRTQFCKEKVEFSFNPTPVKIAFARKYLSMEKKQKVQEIVGNIKVELLNTLKSCSWMDDESKVRVLDKANSIIEIIGAPRDYFDDRVFCQTSDLNYTIDDTDSFFKMFLQQQKLLSNSYYFKIHMNTSDSKMDDFYRLITTVDAMYSILDNIMIIPVGILQGIFFNEERPMYLNYGSIGSIIGHELSHAFGDVGSQFDKEGSENIIWTNKTEENFREKIKCVIDEAENFVVDEDFNINGTATLEENIADFNGFKLSYLAYQEWVQRNGREPQLPGIGYTPNQLFWISSILYECFDINKARAKYELHAYNSFRVIGPMRNNLNFAKDFDCPVGSKMNPPVKCEIF